MEYFTILKLSLLFCVHIWRVFACACACTCIFYLSVYLVSTVTGQPSPPKRISVHAPTNIETRPNDFGVTDLDIEEEHITTRFSVNIGSSRKLGSVTSRESADSLV